IEINVIEKKESYTSKDSFIDNDTITVYKKNKKYSLSSRRIKRSKYKTKDHIIIHADVNGAYNIIVKSNQSDNERLNKVRNWLSRGCRVVQPIGQKVTFN